MPLAPAGGRGLARAAALSLALVLYGGLSAPAPVAVGPREMAVAAALVLAVGWRRPLAVFSGQALRSPGLPAWEAAAILAFSWLLWVPTLRGAAQGRDLGEMARDLVPLVYLFLPLLLVPPLRRTGPWGLRLLCGGLALAGLLFALRWWDKARWGFGAVGTRVMEEGGAYLLNAPAVLFAAVALPLAGLGLWRRGGLWRWLPAPACAVGGLLCATALAGTVHRTAVGLAAASAVAAVLWWARRTPRAALLLLVPLLAVAAAYGEPLAGAVALALEKTRLTGGNARWEEAAAVLEQAGRTPGSLLFGEGWGGLIANPAVGGWRVSYTHLLASYALFKAGLTGLLAVAAYLLALLPAVPRLLRTDPPLAWALLPPLVMALGLHTSFKYLDTGVLLTILLLGAGAGSVPAEKRLSAPSA
ncbi:hypothetical protein [Azospirillum thermophilum]|uniref:O-antigen ligase domain-containing protein n=1 Tax=Azospirillum thermophilum TaxID=2202148 RepID=A0A2S2CRB7_9PROT|nr:hypothetical protein [Azospirillum thermophilum]AWK86965.1 hypothetical protein DEW08_12640 [Azospirillum thermophilum]